MTFNGFDADQKYQYLLFWITELPPSRGRVQAGRAGDHGPGVVSRASRIRAPHATGRGDRTGAPPRRTWSCCAPTSPATGTPSPSCSAGTGTGCGRWPCGRSATARRPPTRSRTRCSRRYRAAGPVPRRLGRHHLAAPDRGQRLPGPDPPPAGAPDRAAARRQPGRRRSADRPAGAGRTGNGPRHRAGGPRGARRAARRAAGRAGAGRRAGLPGRRGRRASSASPRAR